MKYMNFFSRLFCLGAIFFFFSRYQVLAEEKAVLEAENRTQVEAAIAHNKEVQAKMLSDQGIQEQGFYQDGHYQGRGQGYGGNLDIEMTVEKGFVTEINIANSQGEDPVYLDQAEKLLDEMIELQSNDVDTVSGATFSSIGLIEAVGDALQKAV